MSLAAKFFRWHRWLGYLVALQVLAWVMGGLLFSWLPFQAWVKGGDVLNKPRQALPANWVESLRTLPPEGELLGLQSVATASGPALKLRYAKSEVWLSAAGGVLPAADAAQVGDFARSLYKGEGTLVEVKRLSDVPERLVLVRELAGRRDVWLARFDDSLHSRFYFDGRSGELLAVRNEAWVIYDFFWRLHLMDYRGGEDFNNTLLRAAALAALAFTITGLVLSALALRRTWHHWRHKRI